MNNKTYLNKKELPEPLETAHGHFFIDVFHAEGTEVVVARTENIPGETENVLCRIQSECLRHSFSAPGCDCDEQLSNALQKVSADETGGLIIYMRQDGQGLGAAGALGAPSHDRRHYELATDILRDYGIDTVRLMSLNKRKIDSVRSSGIEVIDYFWHGGLTISLDESTRWLVMQIESGASELPIRRSGRSLVVVAGDLNVDRQHTEPNLETIEVGGSGYNAARCLHNTMEFESITFGKIGDDLYGDRIRKKLEDEGMRSILATHNEKSTGQVQMMAIGDSSLHPFAYKWEKINNANEYDVHDLKIALTLAGIGNSDYIFVASYLFVQKMFKDESIQEFIQVVADSGAKLIVDLVRSSLSREVLAECGVRDGQFNQSMVRSYLSPAKIFVLIGEITTFERLGFGVTTDVNGLNKLLIELFVFFDPEWIVCRHEMGGNLCQIIATWDAASGIVTIISEEEQIPTPINVGDGDRLSANALCQIHKRRSTPQMQP